MEIKELRNKLVDITGKIWREAESDSRGHVFQWIHPDAPAGKEADGTEITWLSGSGHVAVYSSDKELMFMQKVSELDQRLTIATEGVMWQTSDDYACEYDSSKQAFIIWHQGMYWISGTPKGYVDALAKAAADVEHMEFIRLQRELS